MALYSPRVLGPNDRKKNMVVRLRGTGRLYCWGLNVDGQLGDGTTTRRLAPTVVAGGIKFQSIGAGDSWTCGLDTAGRAYCWGSIPTATASQTSPKAYTGAPTFTSLSVGRAHACGLTADGTSNSNGTSTPKPTAGDFVPLPNPGN